MENNNKLPTSTSDQVQPIIFQTENSKKRNWKRWILLTTGCIVFILCVLYILYRIFPCRLFSLCYGMYGNLRTNIDENIKNQSTISPTPDPTANLKTYTNAELVGKVKSVQKIDETWKTYSHAAIGATLRYPKNWQLREGKSTVTLFPPDVDLKLPSENISFYFSRALKPSPISSSEEVITVSGIVGRWTRNRGSIPTTSDNIELPYRSGMLIITATKGPAVNLVPQLEEILKTTTLNP